MIEKRSLLEFSPEELKQELIAMGEKPFRAARKPIFPCTEEKQFSPGYGRANSISGRFTPASS